MFYKEAVDSSTLGLLRSLQAKYYLRGFNLAGGTALALYNGHRRSDDIDLFSDFSFETALMLENIVQDFDFTLFFSAPNTLRGAVGNVKVDIIAHRYHLINAPVKEEDIVVLSEPDIGAMKLNAITTSGQRIKDFIDIYFLLEKYDLKTMLGWYADKYNQENDLLILKSLIFYDDVEESEWPVMIKDPDLKWKDIKNKIEKRVIGYSHRATR
ncbi:MAG TPA: nucleotidyl transferase AbiEii/AbiGii toxin family protein [Bacteroidales bacterium]|nr:nucleotidyl transferase AbiEii/AbiGii toxin family protein [Bacteroidales bacterium]